MFENIRNRAFKLGLKSFRYKYMYMFIIRTTHMGSSPDRVMTVRGACPIHRWSLQAVCHYPSSACKYSLS